MPPGMEFRVGYPAGQGSHLVGDLVDGTSARGDLRNDVLHLVGKFAEAAPGGVGRHTVPARQLRGGNQLVAHVQQLLPLPVEVGVGGLEITAAPPTHISKGECHRGPSRVVTTWMSAAAAPSLAAYPSAA